MYNSREKKLLTFPYTFIWLKNHSPSHADLHSNLIQKNSPLLIIPGFLFLIFSLSHTLFRGGFRHFFDHFYECSFINSINPFHCLCRRHDGGSENPETTPMASGNRRHFLLPRYPQFYSQLEKGKYPWNCTCANFEFQNLLHARSVISNLFLHFRSNRSFFAHLKSTFHCKCLSVH